MTSVRVAVSIAAYFKHYMAQVSLHVLLQVYRRWINTEEKAKVVAAVWGTELIQFLDALQDDLKKRINRITATWRNGCFEKMDDPQVHTTPNHQPTKMDVFPKTFLHVILSVKWVVRHSSTSTN